MYGIGHGGAAAITLGAFSLFNAMIMASSINATGVDAILADAGARYMTIVLRGNIKGSVDNRDKAGINSGINEIAVYGWKLTEETRQLAIANASTDVFREGYDLASTYDGIVTLGNAGSYWTVQAPENGKISVTGDTK